MRSLSRACGLSLVQEEWVWKLLTGRDDDALGQVRRLLAPGQIEAFERWLKSTNVGSGSVSSGK